MLRAKHLLISAFSVLALSTLAAPKAHAEFIVDVYQSGSNVVFDGSGSLNIVGLTADFTSGSNDQIVPEFAVLSFGSQTIDENFYYTVNGPTSFGSGSISYATTVSGDTVTLTNTGYEEIGVPDGYVSGAALSSEMIFDDSTIASLGLDDGTYTWTWGTDTTADSFVINVGTDPATVPEPSSIASFAAGLIGLGFFIYRRRKMV